MRAAAVYNSEFLLGDLFRAATMMNRDEFVGFQVDMINKLGKDFHSDFLTVNILHLNDKFLPDGEITSAVANRPRSIIGSYQRVLEFDHFTPSTISVPGEAVFIEATADMDYWLDQTVYRKHCTPVEFHWVLGVSYRFPHHKMTFVAFDYLNTKETPFSPELTEKYVEYVSYPFYLGWLHIYDAICADTLREWLNICAEMTQPRFQVIRGIAGQGVTKANQLASMLDLRPGTIHRHIENSFESLLMRQPERQTFSGKADRIASISQAYRFLEFGPGSASRILPKR